MKYILLLFALLIGQNQLFAQPCQQIDLTGSPLKRGLLAQYIEECHQKRYFFEDKGAVMLVTYQNDKGQTCWYLSAIVDDRYRTSPPEQYALFGDDVILVYRGDSTGRPLPITGNFADRDQCIRDLLGSRVYEYSTKPQYTYVPDGEGKLKKVRVTHVFTGNLHNDLIIRFNKDGTVSKLIPV